MSLGLALAVTGRPFAAKTKPTPCPGGRFVVQSGPLLRTDPHSTVDVIRLGPATGAIDFGCADANLTSPVKLVAKKAFTRVKAAWRGCGGFNGSIRLAKAKIVDGCMTLTGTLRAKRLRTTFIAHLSTCGDGFVDVGGGEQCDAGHPCDAGTCSAKCTCADATTTSLTATTTTTSDVTTTTTQPALAGRPYHSVVPSSYSPGTPSPLVVMLHGYGATGPIEDAYLGLSAAAESKGFLYAFPEGTTDHLGEAFWNATDACCDFDGSGVDDVAYLGAVIDDMAAKFTVDPKRVYVVGHSNGGFMAYRLACDLAAKVAGIVSLGGDTWKDPDRCQPSQPVSVLQIHGTNDATTPYAGGASLPSAATSVATWATYDGCAPTPTASPAIDLDANLAGAETTVSVYSSCEQNSAAQLWSIEGGGHIPVLVATWFDPVYAFLQAHARP